MTETFTLMFNSRWAAFGHGFPAQKAPEIRTGQQAKCFCHSAVPYRLLRLKRSKSQEFRICFTCETTINGIELLSTLRDLTWTLTTQIITCKSVESLERRKSYWGCWNCIKALYY